MDCVIEPQAGTQQVGRAAHKAAPKFGTQRTATRQVSKQVLAMSQI